MNSSKCTVRLLKMKFCSNLAFMFPEGVTLLERYGMAKAAGFKAVETSFPVGFSIEQVREAKTKAGVEQVLINIKTDDVTKGITAVPGKEEEFKRDLQETIDYATALDCKKIHIMAGKLDTVTAKNWETYESNLKFAVSLLKPANIMGVIEPINRRSVPNYMLSDFNKAVEIIKRINSPYLRLELDVFHMQIICGDLSNNIKNLMPYVGHVQIAQVPNRGEPDSPGEINFKWILELVESCGYTDWIGLEYKPAGNTRDGLKWVKDYGYSL